MEPHAVAYTKTGVLEWSDNINSVIENQDTYTLIWIYLDNPEKQILETLAPKIKMHELIVEDCLTPHHFPKVEFLKESTFMISHGLNQEMLIDPKETLWREDPQHLSHQTGIYLWKNIILTVHSSTPPWLNKLFSLIKNRPKKHLNKSPISFTYTLLDHILEGMAKCLDTLNHLVHSLENRALTDSHSFDIDELLDIKTALFYIKQVSVEQKKVLQKLNSSPISEKTDKLYLSDLMDDMQENSSLIDRTIDNTRGVRDAYFATSNVRLSDIMRILAVITTIGTPLNIIVGVYGMNFPIMPLLGEHYGFWFLLSVMVLIIITMLIYFRKKRWL